jgi:hypothetical protein
VSTSPVLSGGHLKYPVVPTLQSVDGKEWMLVSKEDKVRQCLHARTSHSK